jgi:hypothetical protein
VAEFEPKPIRLPGCLPPEFLQALRPLQNFLNQIAEGNTIIMSVTMVGGQNLSYITNAGNLTGELPAAVFGTNIYFESTLGDPLAADGTQVVGGKTISGKAIRTGMSIPASTPFGALWNGTNYTMIWAKDCEI